MIDYFNKGWDSLFLLVLVSLLLFLSFPFPIILIPSLLRLFLTSSWSAWSFVRLKILLSYWILFIRLFLLFSTMLLFLFVLVLLYLIPSPLLRYYFPDDYDGENTFIIDYFSFELKFSSSNNDIGLLLLWIELLICILLLLLGVFNLFYISLLLDLLDFFYYFFAVVLLLLCFKGVFL